MLQKRQGFTTVVDIEEFKKITWSFLTNIKMTWEYNGIAYVLREGGIPLYGFDRGTTKMNHPIATIMLPPSKDVNYGVDIYVPKADLARAKRLVKDEERIRAAAALEEAEGEAYHRQFDRAALESKQHHADERRARRRKKVASIMARAGLTQRA